MALTVGSIGTLGDQATSLNLSLMNITVRLPALVVLVGLLVAACSAAPGEPQPRPGWTSGPTATVAAGGALVVDVYSSPTCSCCHEWVAYFRAHGYTVRSISTDDMAAVKAEHGVPQEAWSCHTAVVSGYAVEGHVPVAAIESLLAERPSIEGIALPGMPPGSPGMPGVKEAPFEVLALADGAATPFGSY